MHLIKEPSTEDGKISALPNQPFSLICNHIKKKKDLKDGVGNLNLSYTSFHIFKI